MKPTRWSFWRQCALTLTVAILAGGCDDIEQIADPSAEAYEALLQLYEELGGDDWANKENWLTAAPVGTWYGVTTDSKENVTGLNLNGNGLKGQIPRSIHALELLESLDLGRNALMGLVPSGISSLKNLRELNLAGNSLTGMVPVELQFLHDLVVLDLRDNLLVGEIPWQLARLGNLEHLLLSGNMLSGSLPFELGYMPSLRHLWLHDNPGLDGPILPDFGHLQVADFNISGTALSGPLPLELMDVPLIRFWWADTDLCAPHDVAFQIWLGKILDHSWGPNC